MGGTYKKKLRAEKAKVKLKGVKLPKGLNVTKTDFKVRKIIISEQLKDQQYVDGRRQFNLKEVLARLKHHSSSLRLEAMRNLRGAIMAGHVNISGHMSELLQGIASNCLDMDKETRRECFKLLSSLLSTLSEDAVAPFFHIISSYLRCAMTHIQLVLQEDSLLMLDVLLQYVPQLLATHSNKIFQNFLEMISRVRSEGDCAGRTLIVHMGQKQTAVKWHTKVLERLQQMLATLVICKQKNSTMQQSVHKINGDRPCQLYTFNAKTPQYYSLKRKYANNGYCDLSSIFCHNVRESCSENANEVQFLRNSIEHLMPLLLEAWLEVRPHKHTGQILLTNDVAHTLKVILEIIENLWCLVKMQEHSINTSELSVWFQQQYAEMFVVNFIDSDAFPYQQMEQIESAKKSKKAKKISIVTTSSGEKFCVAQNICLSYLMCQFHSSSHLLQQQSTKLSLLLQYLHKIVCNLNAYTAQDYRYLTLALRAYLVQYGPQLLKQNPAPLRSLLCATVNAFLRNEFSYKDGMATEILVLLCEIVQTPYLLASYGAEEFVEFLQYLPQLLLKSTVSAAALIVMSNLGKQKNMVFLQALSKQIAPIIENIQKIQVMGACNAFEGKKHIMNLFFWTENAWSDDQRKELLKNIDELITDKRILSYFKFILT